MLRCIFAVTAALVATVCAAVGQEQITVSDLAARTHIHGLAMDPETPGNLLIATHHGIYRAEPSGKATIVSPTHDFMGFTAHPASASILYSSGHPSGGGNLGFMVSTDSGKTWSRLSAGVKGPVDFHQIAISPADPQTIYGAFDGLQVSRDGGKTWRMDHPLPAGLIDLAASSRKKDRIFAGTDRGLLFSEDGGRTWKVALGGSPVSLVEVSKDGELLAFVLGRGLLAANEEDPSKLELRGVIQAGYLAHLVVDHSTPGRFYAATGQGRVLVSVDSGKNWSTFQRN